MREFLEYEQDSGRLVCVLAVGDAEDPGAAGTPDAPIVQDGHAVVEAPEDWDGDLNGWAVRDGALVRLRTTAAERREQERQRRERREQARRRMRQVFIEFIIAGLEEDEERKRDLKAEFKRLKALL